MAIRDLYSKRRRDAAKAGSADVYQYDDIPTPLRVQIGQISLETIGGVGSAGDFYSAHVENPYWSLVEKTFCREKGIYTCGAGDLSGARVMSYMTKCSADEWIDLLELICAAIEAIGSDRGHRHRSEWGIQVSCEDAIAEINYRLREAGVGFQFDSGQIIRVDSQYVHAEVVKSALTLLSGTAFAGPNEEFLEAHRHYRDGEARQAVAMAANALESTFKAVFTQKGWDFEKNSRISDLLKVARRNRLWPDYLDTSFDQLTATLQSGLPKIRDNDASHGQGALPKEVPNYIAAYALHLAASKIVFIVQAANNPDTPTA